MLINLIRRPIGVGMVLMVLVILGIISVIHLPVSLIPDLDVPEISVQISSPQMGAEEIDMAVVAPLRQSLVQMSHLTAIKAESRDGTGVIHMTFDRAAEMDYAYIEVNEKIDRAMSSLPKVERPRVIRTSGGDLPAFYINITGKGDKNGQSFSAVSNFVNNVIVKRLEQLDEVAMVDVSGSVSSEILIIPRMDRLQSLNITLSQFEEIIKSANISLSSLSIRDGEYRYNVKFRHFVSDVSDIQDIWVNMAGRLLQIKDIAAVETRDADIVGECLSDGNRAVVLAIIKQGQAKMSDLRKSISAQLQFLQDEYPDIGFTITRDQTELLDYSIKNLTSSIFLAVILVCAILFLFMKDMKSSLMVAVTIPVSLIISFILFHFLGISINIISLSGLILGVGMMVDNTIVLIDNITARCTRGEDLMKAVTEGTREVSGAMFSSLLTTCAVFIPLVFIKGTAGELFTDQAFSVTAVLFVSYLVTIFAIPVFYFASFRNQDAFIQNRALTRIDMSKTSSLYDLIVSWSIKSKNLAWGIPLAGIVVSALCFAFMEKSSLPEISYSDTIVNIDWNEPIDTEQNAKRLTSLCSLISEKAEQTTILAGVQQFVLSNSNDQSLSEGSIYIKCSDSNEVEDVKNAISNSIQSEYPHALVAFANSGNIFEMVFSKGKAMLEARLSGISPNAFNPEALNNLMQKLRATFPDADIKEVPIKTDVIYEADPTLMALYGISSSQITTALSNALRGNYLFDIVEGEHSLPVVMGYTDNASSDNFLDGIYLVGNGSTSIPASFILTKKYDTSLRVLESGPGGRSHTIAMNINARDVKPAMDKIRSILREDSKYDVSFSGAYFSNREMIRQMILTLLIAILMLYLILASQFESLLQPVIILSEIVIDMAFCLGILWIMGLSLNIMTLIGLIVTSGIVINDSILKIDAINRLLKEGMRIDEAIHCAGHKRLKAIIMTSLTTILAMIPMLWGGSMGADLQMPMSIVIVIGMTVGTLVSLFYVPSLFRALYKAKVI